MPPGATVIVPSFTPGQLVFVAIAEPVTAGPAVTVVESVILHPLKSVMSTVCGPAETPLILPVG